MQAASASTRAGKDGEAESEGEGDGEGMLVMMLHRVESLTVVDRPWPSFLYMCACSSRHT